MSADTFRRLAALGLTNDQIAGVLELLDEATSKLIQADEERKEKGRERWHRWKGNRGANVSPTPANVGQRLQTLANDSREPAHVEDNLPTKKISGSEERKEEKGARAQFDAFWALFPNKVGKRDAEQEFGRALQRSSFDEIMAGLQRYVDKTDDRPWCNPKTFLHQDRWADQPANVPRQSHGPPQPKGVVGAALRIIESRTNGSEIFPSNNGHAEQFSTGAGDRPGTVAEDVRGGLARRFIGSDH